MGRPLAMDQGSLHGALGAAVQAAKGGQVNFRVEKAGIVHAGIGKASFGAEQIRENVQAFFDAVSRAKPSGAKGNYIRKVSLSSTMGVGVRIEPSSIGAG